MSTAVLDVPAARPAPGLSLAPAAARLVVRVAFGIVLLGLMALFIGPRLYPFQGFYVRSGSMSPTIPVGALVVAVPASADELRAGDVIVFERPDQRGTKIVHRIASVGQTPSGRVFLTKGDANSSPDSWQVPATGQGLKAVYSISRAGFAVGWLHAAMTRRGWLGAVAIIAAVFALIWIWQSEEP
jgi:signal peptidase I